MDLHQSSPSSGPSSDPRRVAWEESWSEIFRLLHEQMGAQSKILEDIRRQPWSPRPTPPRMSARSPGDRRRPTAMGPSSDGAVLKCLEPPTDGARDPSIGGPCARAPPGPGRWVPAPARPQRELEVSDAALRDRDLEAETLGWPPRGGSPRPGVRREDRSEICSGISSGELRRHGREVS